MNGEFTYHVAPGVASVFDIDPTGTVIARTSIDRERYSSFSFTVLAVDRGQPSLTGTALVVVTVDDANDERPAFLRDVYTFSVAENEPEGTLVGTVMAHDRDTAEQNTLIRYSFTVGTVTANGISGGQRMDTEVMSSFYIDENSGSIQTSTSLDRERQSIYQVVVLANDPENQSLRASATVTIHVIDRNDNSPFFDFPSPNNNTVQVSTLVPLGNTVTHVVAHDPDWGNNARVTYRFEDGNANGAFTIDELTGDVSINVRFDDVTSFREYELVLVARDEGTPARHTKTVLLVVVNSSLPYHHNHREDEDQRTSAERETSIQLVTSQMGRSVVVGVVASCMTCVVGLLGSVLIAVGVRRCCRRYRNVTSTADLLNLKHQRSNDSCMTSSHNDGHSIHSHVTHVPVEMELTFPVRLME